MGKDYICFSFGNNLEYKEDGLVKQGFKGSRIRMKGKPVGTSKEIHTTDSRKNLDLKSGDLVFVSSCIAKIVVAAVLSIVS